MIRLLMILILLSLLVSGPALGQGIGAVGLCADQQATSMHIEDNAPGVVNIYAIVVYASEGVSAVQFSAPIPECFKGAVYLGETTMFPLVIGNSQAGVAVAFGQCLVSPIHVLTINVFAQGLTDTCCFYPVLPDPIVSSGEVEFVDCDENLVHGTGLTSIVGEFGPPWVGDPIPPDGSTGQSEDTDLSWSVQMCSFGLGLVFNFVYFGTTPDPPMVAEYHEPYWYDPGPLEPGTTYYWKVKVQDTDGGVTTSPVWSFTTHKGIPAEQTTWGKIKALYTE